MHMQRVAQAWLDMARSVELDADCHREAIGNALFHESILIESPHSGFILVKDITFACLCEETLLPFFGTCHIAYVPKDGTILGLSKLSRVTQSLAGKLQRQDRLATDLLAIVQGEVGAAGVAVIIKANHLAPRAHVQNSLATSGCFTLIDNLDEVLASIDVESHDCLKSVRAKQQDIHAALKEERMIDAVKVLLRGIGEDPERQGLECSPARYVAWLLEATKGYSLPAVSPQQHVNAGEHNAGSRRLTKVIECSYSNSVQQCTSSGTRVSPEGSDASSDDMIMDSSVETHAVSIDVELLQLPFTSQCEHHLLPFTGHILIARDISGNKDEYGETMQNRDASWFYRVCAHTVERFSKRFQVQERLTQQIASAIHTLLPNENIMVMCQCKHMCMIARGVQEHCSSTISMTIRGQEGWMRTPQARASLLRTMRRAATAAT